jgi:hypothetical protein
MSLPYNSFGSWMKKTFGKNIFKVNVDAGFTCPNRDGTVARGGCIYCNNDSFRPNSCKPSMSVTEQVENGISYLRKRYGGAGFVAYFQPYTNTYAPVDELEKLYLQALSHPDVIGIAVGTRPDAVDPEKISLLQRLAEKYFVLVEYGLQSVYDKSLLYINRGHDYRCFLDALEMTAGRGIHVGAHVIAGFPTETRAETLAMADEIATLSIGFLKIHQLQVVRHTALAAIFEAQPFPVFSYDEYMDFLVDFIRRLPQRIVLQRLFATAPDDILIAPRWDKSRHEITRDIQERLKTGGVWQGKNMLPLIPTGKSPEGLTEGL